jgi:hypothetical protein
VASHYEFKINHAEVARMLWSPTGMVGRKIFSVGEVVEKRAQELAPKGMRPMIKAQQTVGLRGIAVEVVSKHPATMYVIEGTRPHEIRPRTRKALRFTAHGGGTIFAAVVHHPGTKANNFLLKAMEEARI